MTHSELLKTLAENVRNARRATPHTQGALAEAAGVARSSISKIESNNTVDISLSTVVQIAEALDLPPYMLLMGKEDWNRIATLPSLGLLVEQRMGKAINLQIESLQQEAMDNPDKAAGRVHEAVMQMMAAGNAEADALAVASRCATWIATAMLPSLPIVNGLIGQILARKKPTL